MVLLYCLSSTTGRKHLAVLLCVCCIGYSGTTHQEEGEKTRSGVRRCTILASFAIDVAIVLRHVRVYNNNDDKEMYTLVAYYYILLL